MLCSRQKEEVKTQSENLSHSAKSSFLKICTGVNNFLDCFGAETINYLFCEVTESMHFRQHLEDR